MLKRVSFYRDKVQRYFIDVDSENTQNNVENEYIIHVKFEGFMVYEYCPYVKRKSRSVILSL